jgi:ABC-2 type transport system permease protein
MPDMIPLGPPLETAPSATLDQGPSFARGVAFVGLFLFVLGLMVVVSTRVLGPRWVPEGWGFILTAFGLVLMLYHAVSDGQQDIRRTYGGFALLWLVAAIFFALVPGPLGNEGTKTVGHYLLPWGVGFGLIGLLFIVPFCRHETEEVYRNAAVTGLLVVGGFLAIGSVAAGIFKPEFLAGPGLTLAILGLAFLCAYLGQVDTSDGLGFTVAFSLGAFGAAVVVFAIFRAAFPTLLYEGPTVLRLPNGSLDIWKATFRLLGGVAFLIPAAIAFAVKAPGWLKGVTGLVGLVGAGVVVVSLFTNPVHTSPTPFLVPNGLILILLGLVYLAVALGVCSDNQFVTLTRRELSSYFLSPIGYLVLAAMAAVQWYGYWQFYEILTEVGRQQAALPEPIVRFYFYSLFPVFAIVLQVPALTMRLLAEERRSGSLEVLFTAPVNETPVVLSKFLATWIFFLVCWIPPALFLIALRIESGQEFDYRPLLSFYVALAACGAAFVSAGLFFSAISSNQIVAAVLTLALLLGLVGCHLLKEQTTVLGATGRQFMTRLSYIDLWLEALKGQLPLRDVLVWLSAAILGLFASIKVLEARKWN